MTNITSNLRKAAVLLRSVDAETAATLLAQLSSEEAGALREAVRSLGPLDPEEQADMLAEFRRKRPLAGEAARRGVELAISSNGGAASELPAIMDKAGRRFEFLDNASANMLASYLSREQAQTVAVVLTHLAPERAAAVLAALPERLQTDVMERLANLGDTDSEVVNVLERELAVWVSKRSGDSRNHGQRRDAVSSILAAADSKTRTTIVANLKSRNAALADRFEPTPRRESPSAQKSHIDEYRVVRTMAKRNQLNTQLRSLVATPADTSLPALSQAVVSTVAKPVRPSLPRIDFDQLVHLDSRMLAQLLAVADPNLLALALGGSSDELVERVCDQMPKRVAKVFRRELRRMGPMRLSDVEGAQRAIADLAAQQIAARRSGAQSFAEAP